MTDNFPPPPPDIIHVIGGNDGVNILNTVESYDYVLRRVIELPRMKERRDELAVTAGADGKIYAIGGFGGDLSSPDTCLRSVERFNPILGSWETIASLNMPRRALSAVALSDGVYAIGGFDGQDYLNSVER